MLTLIKLILLKYKLLFKLKLTHLLFLHGFMDFQKNSFLRKYYQNKSSNVSEIFKSQNIQK